VRGLFRLSLVLSVLWIGGVALMALKLRTGLGASSMWEVGNVVSVQIPKGFGYGFNVTTDRGKRPLLLLGTKRRRRPKPPQGRLQRLLSGPFSCSLSPL
jgi:hypothetical protein